MYDKSPNKTKLLRINPAGFNLLESMIALTLLTTIMLGLVLFETNNNRKKDAKILSQQTDAFAAAYAKYMQSEYKVIQQTAAKAPLNLNPQIISAYWPANLTTQNMYRQTPCVTILHNKTSNKLEAIMYYVGGKQTDNYQQLDIARSAVIELGNKGGLLMKQEIKGNSGWSLSVNSDFFKGEANCGGKLAENSLVVNLDLMPEWNQNLQPAHSIMRGLDNTSGELSLPGHSKNSNTSKNNLYFAQGNGVVLDAPSNTKLSIMRDDNKQDATPVLGLNNNTATLVGDTFQPDMRASAGDECTSGELGKTIADKGINEVANQFLTRSTLVCTQNDLLCGVGQYCFLPSHDNRLVFRNMQAGIQDYSGQFHCPTSVPFAVDLQAGVLGGNAIYVIANKDSSYPQSSIMALLGKLIPKTAFAKEISCGSDGCDPPLVSDFKSLASILGNPLGQIENVDLATLKGTAYLTSSGGGKPKYDIIYGNLKGFKTPVGYQVFSGFSSCAGVCDTLGNQLGNKWQLLGTNRQARANQKVDILNNSLGCACERTDFNEQYGYTGISVVMGGVQAIITSVTCSNMPVYYN